MAKQNINPFGPNAEMPAGYPIADNLKTDSAQQALSARQGKELGDYLFGSTYVPIDLSEITEIEAFITEPGSGAWKNVWITNNSNVKSKLIPVSAGETYQITADTAGCQYALLASNTIADQQEPDYVDGVSARVYMPAGNSVQITMPSDCRYLYVATYVQGTDTTPIVAIKTDTAGISNYVADKAGKEASKMQCKNEIFVAAYDAPSWQKDKADYVCEGQNDEVILQRVINSLENGGVVRLSMGHFNIDSFPNYDGNNDGGSYIAIKISVDNNTGREVRILGDHLAYGSASESGTHIQVSDACYAALDANRKYKILSSTYFSHLANGARISLVMMDIKFTMPWNQRKIMCIDLRSVNRVYLQRIICAGYRKGYNGYNPITTNPPDVAVEGCIGIRMTSGSNYGMCNDYRNITCAGFYEGFQVGGEHVIGINLSGIWNVYSYTFGNYPWNDAFAHPITLINCCDERSVNLPLFAYCGLNRGNQSAGQQITLIDFNLERYAGHTPGGVLGELATELDPGTFHGEISYTVFDNATGLLSTNQGFWKDGHGQRFISRNSTHKLACGTTERNGYAPNYLQRIWDTSLNKEVICVDTATKEWRDAMGNIV